MMLQPQPNIDAIIQQVRQRYYSERMRVAEKEADKKWPKYEALIRDYYGGLRIVEVARKHEIRSSVVHNMFRDLRVPKISKAPVAVVKNIERSYRKSLPKLRACGCDVCTWIANRIELDRKYGIEE